MMYKAKVTVCSEIRTKHSVESEHHVEFLSGKPGTGVLVSPWPDLLTDVIGRNR